MQRAFTMPGPSGWRRVSVLLLVLALIRNPAHAESDRDCTARLIQPRALTLLQGTAYQVFGTGLHAERLALELDIEGGPCTLAVGFSGATARDGARQARNGRHSLNYWFSDQRSGDRRLRDRPAANDRDLLEVSFAGGRRRLTLAYFALVPAGQAAFPGSYEDTATISVYRTSGRLSLPLDTQPIRLRFEVPPAVESTLVSSRGESPLGQAIHVLDLGPLRTGLTHRFDLTVRANTDYALSLSSGNKGRLRSTRPGSTPGVSYELDIDGRAVDLARTTRLSGSNERNRTRHRFNVRIGSVERVPSGEYEDTLHLTISAE